MKRFFIVNLFIATLFAMASCTSNTPGSNAVKFNRLIKQGKINEAVQMVRVEGADSIEIANHTAAVRDIVENRIAALSLLFPCYTEKQSRIGRAHFKIRS